MCRERVVGWYVGKPGGPQQPALQVDTVVRVRCGTGGVIGTLCGFSVEFSQAQWDAIQKGDNSIPWEFSGLTVQDLAFLRQGACPRCSQPVAKERKHPPGGLRQHVTTGLRRLVGRPEA